MKIVYMICLYLYILLLNITWQFTSHTPLKYRYRQYWCGD